MQNPIYIGVIENVAILISIAILYDFIWLRLNKQRIVLPQIVLGFIIGLIAIILMKSPWILVEGIIFDTRSVLLAITGLFFGGLTTVIAMLIAALYRLYLGGAGMYMGVAVILTSSIIGFAWRKLRPQIIESKQLHEVYLLSMVVHIVMLACTVFLPKEIRIKTLEVIWWPVLLIYPAATALIAKLLFARDENWQNRNLLIENENKYRLLFDNNPNPMWIYDLETLKFLEVNDAATIHYGYSKEEFLRMTLKDIRPAEDIPTLLDNIETATDKYQSSSYWKHRKKDGSIILVTIVSHSIDYNGRPTRHVLVNDVTGLIQSQEEISRREREFREIFNSSMDSIQIGDIETGKIVDCNDRTAEMFGYTKEEILNGSITDLSANVAPYNVARIKELIKKTIDGEPQDFEWLAHKKNGELFWVNVRLKLAEIGGKNRVMAIVRDISEKKKIEEDLIESEQRFLRVIHFSSDAIGILDQHRRFVECNDAAAQLHGYKSRGELLKQLPKPENLSPDKQPDGSDSSEKAREMVEIALEEGFNRFEWIHKKKNDELFLAEVSLTPIIYRNERMVYAVWHDITERKQRQEQLENLSRIFEKSLNEIYIFRSDTFKFIDANPAALNNLGYSKSELIELTPLDIKPRLTPDDFKEIVKPVITNQQPKAVFETIHKRKDGSEYPVEVHLQKVMYSNKEALLAMVLDIHQKKKLVYEIIQREREFREIFESTHEAILVFDYNSLNIVDCNSRTLELYGYDKKEELIGKTVGCLSSNVDEYNKNNVIKWVKKAKNEGPQTYQWLGKKKNGELIWVDISLKSTIIGEKERILAVVRDIGERKQYEEDLVRAKEKAEESDRLKSAFLANLSHEIRTPMNAIMGFADLLRSTVNEQKKNEYIEIIQKSGTRLLEIIGQTIEVARLDSGMIKLNPEVFDLNQLMKDIYNEVKIKSAANKELDINLLPSNIEGTVNIFTDRVKLQQILINLLTNGIKYTPRGAVSFGFNIVDNRVVFHVTDTGIGIDKKHQGLIFKRFFRVENPHTIKASGIGLGLPIAKAYTELLGGTIALESEIGRGTKVTVSIPYLKDVEKEEISVEPDSLKVHGEKELILVAEDDEYNFLFINEILRQLNFKCMRASNGKEAVELAQKVDDIKLILMDIKMPVMDGYAAIEQIKKMKPGLPVVAQTAYALGEDVVRIESCGFDGYIRKPIKKSELLSIIQSKLKK